MLVEADAPLGTRQCYMHESFYHPVGEKNYINKDDQLRKNLHIQKVAVIFSIDE